MKTGLQLRLKQQLALTPQLQQSIRLLQLSSIDLQNEVQQMLESNPLLEQVGHEEEHIVKNEESKDSTSTLLEENIPEDLSIDANWSNIYDYSLSPKPSKDESPFDIDSIKNTQETLQECLLWQAYLNTTSEREFFITSKIIDAINEQGYLDSSLKEIIETIETDIVVESEEVQAVLSKVHNFDPPGIGARDLKECLLLQLNRYPTDTPLLDLTKWLVLRYLPDLAEHNYEKIIREINLLPIWEELSREKLDSILKMIRSLNPYPGYQVQSNKIEYIIPDVYVTKSNGRWKTELNLEVIPQLRINSYYKDLTRKNNNAPATQSYLKNQLQDARWFIKGIHVRNETLLKTATCIVKYQQKFLEHGNEIDICPLVLHDVAESIAMNKSTVSRITTNKYMNTPWGIFELKYFFSSSIKTENGEGYSSTAIRAAVKKLIAQEPANKPLSDNAIALVLEKQGIKISRRTVTKYREFLNIPTSSERKKSS